MFHTRAQMKPEGTLTMVLMTKVRRQIIGYAQKDSPEPSSMNREEMSKTDGVQHTNGSTMQGRINNGEGVCEVFLTLLKLCMCSP